MSEKFYRSKIGNLLNPAFSGGNLVFSRLVKLPCETMAFIFVTDWLEEMDDDDRMEFEGKRCHD